MSRENGANISWAEYENEQPQGILLDIRDNVAYQYGTVKGAIHVMPADCGRWACEQDKEVPVFVLLIIGAVITTSSKLNVDIFTESLETTFTVSMLCA